MDPPVRNEEGYDYTGSGDVERTAAVSVVGSSALEILAGAAGVVLTIIGLAVEGMHPPWLLAVSSIVIGGAFLARGAALAGWSKDLSAYTGKTGKTALFGGAGIELLGGAAGVVFGVLALIGLVPNVLLSIATICFGGVLLLSSGALIELARRPVPGSGRFRSDTREVGYAAGGFDVLAGVAAVVLGIIALATQNLDAQKSLTLVGMLASSAALVIAGAASGARFVPEVRVQH